MTGSIVTFDDAIPFMPIEKLVAQIEPQQDLHGYDAPWAGGAGKNLFDQDTCTTGKYIDAYGEPKDSAGAEYSDYIHVTAGEQYIFSGTNNTGGQATTRIHGYNSSKVWVQQITSESVADTVKWDTAFTVPEGISFVRVSTGYPLPDGQLEKGSVATAWTPYANVCPITGRTGLNGWVEEEYDPAEQPSFSVSWQTEAGTVYDGYIDVVSGELVATYGVDTYDGSSDETWNVIPADNRAYISVPSIKTPPTNNDLAGILSNEYKEKPYNNVALNKPAITARANITQINVFDDRITSDANWRSLLASNPLQVVFPLAQPLTYQLTQQEVMTLVGQNNAWVDTGDVSVTYQSTSGSTPVRTSFKSPLKSYSYNALKLFGNTFIEHGKG